MTDTERAIVDLAAAIPVSAPSSISELTRRLRRQRRVRGTVAAAGLAAVLLVAGVLVPQLVSPGSGHGVTAGSRNLPAQTVALVAGRRALAASGGPPVGSMGLVGPASIWVLDGDGLFVSGDGGSSWKQVAPPGAGDPLANYESIEFLSAQQGWLAVSGMNSIKVYRTTDGGSAWQSAALPASLFPDGWESADLSFLSPADGWLTVQLHTRSGEPVQSLLLSSTDGGASWSLVNAKAPVTSIKFSSPAMGWGLGADGATLYRTTNGGRSWAPVTLPRPAGFGAASSGWNSLTLPEFAGADAVVLAVPRAGNAVTERSTDGGQSWQAEPTPFAGEPAAMPVLRPAPGPACAGCVRAGDEPFAVLTAAQWRYWAGGRLYSTADYGLHWSSAQPNLSFAGLGTTLGRVGADNQGPSDPLQFSSQLTGWALASTNTASGPESVLLVTGDGGATFAAISPPRGSG
jgi:photosystem II stability/assembly factor-like uncharacterized protein